jgi:hypothetical protein
MAGTVETVDYGEDVSMGKVGGVFKRILREGSGSKSPQPNAEVGKLPFCIHPM